jgi:hypothetical protein
MITLSIDPPGGLCFWKDKAPVLLRTVELRGSRKEIRCENLLIDHSKEVESFEKLTGDRICRVGMEDYVQFVARERGRSLMTNCLYSGILFGFWVLRGITPELKCKGTAPKAHANIAAYAYFAEKFIDSEHSRDALLIGHLLGFGTK